MFKMTRGLVNNGRIVIMKVNYSFKSIKQKTLKIDYDDWMFYYLKKVWTLSSAAYRSYETKIQQRTRCIKRSLWHRRFGILLRGLMFTFSFQVEKRLWTNMIKKLRFLSVRSQTPRTNITTSSFTPWRAYRTQVSPKLDYRHKLQCNVNTFDVIFECKWFFVKAFWLEMRLISLSVFLQMEMWRFVRSHSISSFCRRKTWPTITATKDLWPHRDVLKLLSGLSLKIPFLSTKNRCNFYKEPFLSYHFMIWITFHPH